MNKNLNKKIKLLPLLLAALLLFTACGSKNDTPQKDDPVNPPVIDPQPEPPVIEPEPILYMNPLSGEMGKTDITNNRPFAVMINDHVNAQPQLGIQKADIIYEVIAEGGITRMMAVFQSLEGVGNIGTVRSARPYYINLALGHDAIFIHAGGSDDAYELLEKTKIDHMDGVRGAKDAAIFWRDEYRKKTFGTEHSLLTSAEKALAYVASAKLRTEHKSGYDAMLKFGESPATSEGGETSKIAVQFSGYKTSTFQYDEAEKTYKVFQSGKYFPSGLNKHIDGDTNEQLTVKNILVLNTTSKIYDDYGRNIFETTGKNSGTYYCEGKTIEISWERQTVNDPIQYKRTDGSPLELMPGNTYVCIINPKNSNVSFE